MAGPRRSQPGRAGDPTGRSGPSGRAGKPSAAGRGQGEGRPASSRGTPRAAPHDVRLIGGEWKRSRLPVADLPGLRPTPDRVRETLFNWLGQDLSGWRCLDAFAGTGALGLEAASRGASAVTLVERHPAAARALREAVNRFGAADRVTVRAADALSALRAATPGSLDLVLLDPPFDAPGLADAALAAALPLVAPGGWLYLEAPAPMAQDVALGPLAPWRQGRAGAVHYHLLRRNNIDEPPVGPAAEGSDPA